MNLSGLPGIQNKAGDVHRDWKKLPAIVQIDTAEDVYAVGDVHGDYERLAQLLAGAKLIAKVPGVPEKAKWTGSKSVVVFTGDIIDKGPNMLGAIALIQSLQESALQDGGRVVVLMGNHEADFLTHPDTDKAKDFLAELKKAGLDNKQVALCRNGIGQFLCSMSFGARVNDWFFSHAGNSNGRTLSHLESDLENGIDSHGFGTPELSDPNSLVLARLGAEGPGGKSWFEAGGAKQTPDQLLAAYASAMGVAHIVEGHAPSAVQFPDGAQRQPGQMFQWHGLLFLIDTGMSRTVNYSSGAVLQIKNRNGQAYAICPDGSSTRIWDAKGQQTIGFAPACHI